MVFTAAFVSAVLFSGFASGLPRPEPSLVTSPVSAPSVTDSASPIAAGTQSTGSYTVTSSGAVNYGAGGSYGPGSYSSSLQWSQTQSTASYATPSSVPSYGTGYSSDGSQSLQSSSMLSTSSVIATSTASASGSYSTPAYGSGSSNWGAGYDDCVAQCVASFGSPAASYAPTATVASATAGAGTGATITVIVAPTQGVLRYVPFAVNASVGDTIKFMWGANNHTVTKSSELLPCNKSADALFTSGTRDKDFVFTQVVNDTNPTFYYCGTPGHCQKGMFGIINPPNALGAPTSVAGMMSSLGANNSDISAYASYTSKSTANNFKAGNWGANIDMASLPNWSHSFVAENVLYTRNFLASNTEVLKDDGSIDLSGSTPLMIPQDISAALANASPTSTTSGTPAATTTPVSSFAPASSGTAGSSSSGASSLASPKAIIGLFVIFVTIVL